MTLAELIAFLQQIRTAKNENTVVLMRACNKDFEVESLQFVRDKPIGGKTKDAVYICARNSYPEVL